MSEERTTVRRKVIGYTVCGLFGIVGFLLICWINDYWTLESDQERLRVLCDAFTVPGVLLVFGAGLIFAANKGAFYGVGYGLRTAKEILLPFLPHEYVKYRDYIAQKKEKQVKGYRFIFISGMVFLAVGIVLLIRFNILYPNA